MPKKKEKLLLVQEEEEEEEKEEQELPTGPVENAWFIPLPKFNKGDMKHSLTEESKFKICFPKYREKYIRESWPIAEKVFEEHGIKGELDLMEGVMSVATTRKTWDPYVILKARDVIKLLGRSVPVEQAIKLFNDGTTCEIIKIKNLVRNRERLIKRRQRLIGSNGTALKTLELLTNCYVLVQGCTVAAIGPHKGVQQVVRVVMDTMKNIHPINLLKALMIKRGLAKDPEKKGEDWSKYIPSYSSRNVQKKKPKVKKKKPYTPFPPERVERKVEGDMETGQYFMEESETKKWYRKDQENRTKSKEKQKEKRSKPFEAPTESSFVSQSIESKPEASNVDLEKLKKKLKNKAK